MITAKSHYFFASLYGLHGFLVAVVLAWGVMAQWDFFYGVWHDHGGIKQGIEEFGPKNRYKPGFHDTTKAQREEVFHLINVAVHRQGEGLADIRYQSPTSRGEQVLLRPPEVVHLQDVANLISVLAWPAVCLVLFWPGVIILYLRRKGGVPKLSHQLIGLVALVLCLGVILIVVGPETVFNTLHIWIFPDEHQWFFYYQESLMSTMMYAPRLFAWIAGAWGILAVVIFFLLSSGLALAAKRMCR
ncbi:MAG: DUF1461 domain-containing protein [Agarilytica sp.]